MASVISGGVKAASRKRLVALARADAREKASAAEQLVRSEAGQLEALQARYRAAFDQAVESLPNRSTIRKELNGVAKELEAFAKERVRERPTFNAKLQALRGKLASMEQAHGAALREASKRAFKRDEYLAGVLKAFRKRGRVELKEAAFGAIRMRFIPD